MDIEKFIHQIEEEKRVNDVRDVCREAEVSTQVWQTLRKKTNSKDLTQKEHDVLIIFTRKIRERRENLTELLKC